jgi:predicted acyltransferase
MKSSQDGWETPQDYLVPWFGDFVGGAVAWMMAACSSLFVSCKKVMRYLLLSKSLRMWLMPFTEVSHIELSSFWSLGFLRR